MQHSMLVFYIFKKGDENIVVHWSTGGAFRHGELNRAPSVIVHQLAKQNIDRQNPKCFEHFK